MAEENRIEEILSAIQKIERSELSVREYFKKRNDVPFFRAQYYIYHETLQKYGEEGLRDKRKVLLFQPELLPRWIPYQKL